MYGACGERQGRWTVVKNRRQVYFSRSISLKGKVEYESYFYAEMKEKQRGKTGIEWIMVTPWRGEEEAFNPNSKFQWTTLHNKSRKGRIQ